MRFNSREAALMGIPDLPPNAFVKALGKNAPRTLEGGGGIPIVSDVVEAVGDVVGDVVDFAVDVVNDIPIVGDIADDVLGLDPNGGGIVPIVKGVATGIVLSPVGGFVGGALNTGLGLGLGTAGQAALGGAAFGAATGGVQGALTGAAGGYIGGTISEYMNSNGTVTQIFDDGSTLTYDASGNPLSGVDIDGNAFNVVNGIGQYTDGTPLTGTPSPAAQAPQWQQQGYASEADYADSTLRGFDNPQTYNDALQVGIESQYDLNVLRDSGFTLNEIGQLNSSGIPTSDIVYGAERGFTPEEMKIFANDQIRIGEYVDQGFTPDQVRAFSGMDVSIDDINAMRDLGFSDAQIATSAQQGTLDPDAYKWYADRGYNPQAVYETALQGNSDLFNDLYAAGPDASWGRATQINDLSPAEMIRQAQLDPGSIESGRFTVGGQKIGGLGFGTDNITVRLEDGRLIKYDYNTGEVLTKAQGWDPTWKPYDYVEPTVAVPEGTAPAPVSPTTPVVAPSTPATTPTTGTTTQVFDDGSRLIIDNATGSPVGGVDSGGNTFTVSGGQGTYTGGAPLSQPPATAPTDTQIFDDGSQLTYNTQTGQPISGVDTEGAGFTTNPVTNVPAYDTTGAQLGGTPQLPPTTTQVFDDGSKLTYDTQTGQPISGVDSNGDTFTVNPETGVGTYDIGGRPLSEPPPPVVDLSRPVDPADLATAGAGAGSSLIPGVSDLTTGLVAGAVLPGVIGGIVAPGPQTPRSPYEGQTFTPTAPGERWSQDLITPEMIPSYVGRAASVPYYNTTSPVQSQYYWGVHPYVPLNQDLSLYNQIPEAPPVPWGLQQGFFEQPSAPTGQVTYAPDMTPTWTVR